jgi:hypothetical protein
MLKRRETIGDKVRRVIAGAVYSARAGNGRSVAIKVVNINGLPMSSQKLVQVYLNEVALLGRLQQESDHVVVIYDFDFDAQQGLGECTTVFGQHARPRHGSFSVHRHGARRRESRHVDLSVPFARFPFRPEYQSDAHSEYLASNGQHHWHTPRQRGRSYGLETAKSHLLRTYA